MWTIWLGGELALFMLAGPIWGREKQDVAWHRDGIGSYWRPWAALQQQIFSVGSPAKLTDQPKFIVKPLQNEDRAALQCGKEALDRYFRERALRDMANRLSAVFIVVPENDHKTMVSFFTLSSQQTACDILPEELRKETGRYKAVGVTLLGRMAAAQEFQNRKPGRFVLFAALYEAWRSTQHVSSFAVVVDAKTEKLVPFYKKYGFRGSKAIASCCQ
jgi:predicted GNAT family N-acyltransferase